MNELDYIRDNRLRLWFIGRCLPAGLELRGKNRDLEFANLMRAVCTRLAPGIAARGAFVLVVGDATRGGGRGRTAAIVRGLFARDKKLADFKLVAQYRDTIPDVRRARRECRGTKQETILIYRKR